MPKQWNINQVNNNRIRKFTPGYVITSISGTLINKFDFLSWVPKITHTWLDQHLGSVK